MKSQLLSSTAATIAVTLSVAAAAPARAQSGPPEAATAVAAASEPDGDIIVTGTRAGGITAAESAAPIKVLSAETLEHIGQPNLNQALTQLVPSFTAQAFGGDTANLTLSARLRGLSPNHTLVLINGKRRHGTSNLAVLGGPFQGAATADLDLIPQGAIERIEVLEDGAAAQYGSDAIAGVINIILKSDSEGGDAFATAGQYYDVGGETAAGSVHLATRVGDSGFINVTAFHRYNDFTIVGGIDRRVSNPDGSLLASLSAAQRALYANIPNFPYVNLINGNARSHLTDLQFNSGYDFGGVEVYSFGTYSRRIASAYENLRVPDRVIASPVLGVRGTLTTPGELIFDTDGFSPREGIREEDFAFTGGVRGDAGGFHYDLSATYGRDRSEISTLDSANASLFVDTHFTPTTFYNGFFKNTELTLNADFNHEIDLGMAKPLNVAFGGEYRRNVYQIGSGDPGSIYKEGGQSYPGFRPSDAGINTRTAKSLYLDIAAFLNDDWKVDGAIRYEHYSDFGSKVIFRATTRYDFSDAFALRGTVSTGFRAPTLAESFYSATNVSPTSAFVQLPANSAAAKLLGFDNLEPEKSTNFSLGTVIRPAPSLTITLDAYQVKIEDRILGTGSIFGSGGATNFPIVTAAIVANGNVLDPTVSQTGINIFTNGANTRTRGVDLVISYLSDFGDAGSVNWTLTGNYNETKVTSTQLAPATLGNIPLFDQGAISNLEGASPKVKLIAGAFYELDRFSATLRGTLFGKSSQDVSPDGGTFYRQEIGTTVIADLELSYDLSDLLTVTAGANNLFNETPPTIQLLSTSTVPQPANSGNVYDAPLNFSPYGINGGYYYGRINFKF